MNILQSVYKLVRIRTKADACRWAASATITMTCFAIVLVNFLHKGYFQLSVASSVAVTALLIAAPATYWASYQLYLIYQLGIKFKSQAEVDSLTGARTRRYLFDTVFEKLKSGSSDYVLLMVDLDHFKFINDNHNHLMGDQVLKHVANSMTQACRRDDVVCRFGGEEFVVVLPDCEYKLGEIVAERIRSKIASEGFQAKGVQISVTVSIGVAQGRPTSKLENVIQAADEALYKAKETGRNRIVLNAPGIQTNENAEAELLNEA